MGFTSLNGRHTASRLWVLPSIDLSLPLANINDLFSLQPPFWRFPNIFHNANGHTIVRHTSPVTAYPPVESMSIGGDIVGVTILAVLPVMFLAARFAAKKTKSLSWSLDDTLLVLALVRLQCHQQRAVL